MAPKRAPPPPPSGQAPVSQEVVQIIKKKLAAPSGRPPAGMENFKIPKHLSPRKKSNDDDDDEDNYEDDSPYNKKYNNKNYDDDNKRSNKTRYDDDNDYISDEGWNRDSSSNNNNNNNNRRRHNKSSSYDNDRGPGTKARDNDDTDDISFDADSRDNSQRKQLIENKQNNNAAKSNTNNDKKKLIMFSFAPILKATYRDLKAFITGSCPENFLTRCYIERNRNGSNMLTPFYSLCADLEDGTGRELAVCRKVLMSTSSYYIFSLKSEDLYRKREMRSRLYLGKLRAYSNNEYILYDNGIERTSEHGISDDEDDGKVNGNKKSDTDNTNFRKELCCIYFNSKSRPSPPTVRGMEVCIPNADSSDPSSSQKKPSTIRQSFSRIREDGTQNTFMKNKYYILNERTSKYDPLSSCLVDFKGRANVPSVKNFQLVESTPNQVVATDMIQTDFDKEYILQMGKTTDDCFNMDFKHPLSVLQAFAICIARFDAKLSW